MGAFQIRGSKLMGSRAGRKSACHRPTELVGKRGQLNRHSAWPVHEENVRGVLYTILYFSSAQASAPAPTCRAGGKPRSRAAWILQPPLGLSRRPLARVHAERPVHAHSILCPRKRGTLMPTSGWDALCLCSLSVLSVCALCLCSLSLSTSLSVSLALLQVCGAGEPSGLGDRHTRADRHPSALALGKLGDA